jgi:hypothetical protein
LVRTTSAQQRRLAGDARAEEEELHSDVRAGSTAVCVRCRSVPDQGGPSYCHARAPLRSGTGNILGVLTDELLVTVAISLLDDAGSLVGFKSLGRLGCACKPFMSIANAAIRLACALTLKAELKAAATVSNSVATYCGVEPAPEGLILAFAGVQARVAAARQRIHTAEAGGKLWLRTLWELRFSLPRLQPRWRAYSAAHYTVSGGGATLTVSEDPSGRAVLAGAPMAMGGGAGAVYYAEVEVLALATGVAWIGVGRPGLDVFGRQNAYETTEFWGVVSSCTGDTPGELWHANQAITWAGIHREDEHIPGDEERYARGYGPHFPEIRQSDTLGLLLDGGAGTLTFYRKGTFKHSFWGWDTSDVWDSRPRNMQRLGVAVEGLTGELCWAVAMRDNGRDANGDGGMTEMASFHWELAELEGHSLRIRSKPPPLDWRTDTTGSSSTRFIAVSSTRCGGDWIPRTGYLEGEYDE